MKTVFAHLSRDLEEPIFRLIGEYSGTFFNYGVLFTLVFRVTKRRYLGAVMVERQDVKSEHFSRQGDVVQRDRELVVSRRFLRPDMWSAQLGEEPEDAVVRCVLETIPGKFRGVEWWALFNSCEDTPIADYPLMYGQNSARNEKPAPKNKWFPTSAR